METRKEKAIGMAGTVFFHLLLMLFLLFNVLAHAEEDTLPDELEGVPVMFGNVPDALGNAEALGTGNTSTPIEKAEQNIAVPPTAARPIARNYNPILTQSHEQTIAIKAAEKAAADEKKRQATEAIERTRKQAEAARIASQMGSAFGNGSGTGSRGNTQGTGTQGVPTGNASHGATSGVGGNGTFSLGGRSLASAGLAKPSYAVDDYGTVVIDIIVDAKGNVVEATIGKGTNTTSSTLKNESVKAALKTKFNTVTKAANQKGSITYKFNLN